MGDLVIMLSVLALYLIALGIYYCFGALSNVANAIHLLIVRINTLLEQRHE